MKVKSFTSLEQGNTHSDGLVLRLYPVLPISARTANKDTFLPTGGGPDRKSPVFVPKNTIVQINTQSLHRRKDIYGPDADEFKPERWASAKSLSYWDYAPFSGGPRICIGRKSSHTILACMIIDSLQQRNLRSWKPHTLWYDYCENSPASRAGSHVRGLNSLELQRPMEMGLRSV